MADMDPQLLQFLRLKVNSFVKWDLVRFFHQNPHTTDTAHNIARYAGRDADTVSMELAALAKDGVLEVSRLGDMIVYSLATDGDTRDILKLLVESANDRQFRLKVIYHIIRGMEW